MYKFEIFSPYISYIKDFTFQHLIILRKYCKIAHAVLFKALGKYCYVSKVHCGELLILYG